MDASDSESAVIGLTEGVEDALAMAMLFPGLSTWATLGTGGMHGIRVPRHVRKVIIMRDSDAPGQSAALALRERLDRIGIEVHIVRAREHKDAAELVLHTPWVGERAYDQHEP
jgi:DNA primase